ncbi:class I SAM-dependent methyltransferase [Bernardetia sp. OM2101]|uniref:class I SAM-dependent methyltransferase n=1 Tax=Bernardetia sp. OM2101 TaxID=3344876 RepID=UPI0035CFDC17
MKEDKASSTAYTVLQGQLLSAINPAYKGLVSEETVIVGKQILNASAEGRKRLKQLNSKVTRFFAPLVEKILMPGITLHYVLRKQFIEDATCEGIKNGATQVVNLGAGFDTLAWRLHKKHPEVNFIEIDHPATNKQKAKALFDKSPTNLHLLPVDLSQEDTGKTLKNFPSFDSNRKTIFICEGVLMYLTESEVVSLFNTLKNVTNQPINFIFTCVEPIDSPNNNVGVLLRIYLKFKSEPLKWLLEQKNMKAFLDKQNYEINDIAATNQLKKRYLKNIKHGELHHGEYLVFAVSK